jgi:uncharacterized protein (DUF885 family)
MAKKSKIKSYILRTLGALVIIASIFVVNLIWFKPFSIDHFFTRVVVEMVIDSPETLTSMGFLEGFGITGHNADLNDASMASGDETFAMLHADYDMLMRYDDDSLSDEQRLSKRIMAWILELALKAEQYRFHTYPMNNMMGSHTGIPSFLDTFHIVGDADDGDNYLSRLSQIARVFDQELEGLEYRRDHGIIPPTFIIERVLETINGFVSVPANENILYTSFAGKIAAADEISDEDGARLLADAETLINDSVYPAYAKLAAHFEGLLPLSNTDAGYWRMPGGSDAYQLALTLFNTTTMTPDEIHAIGLSEVARIQGEVLEILDGEGIDISGGFSAAMEIVKADPDQYFEDSDAGREAMLAYYVEIIDEMYEHLPEAFSRLPQAGVEVRRIQEFQEATTPSHYNQPSLDGSRPGIFYANLHDVSAEPRYSMRSLSYHEAVPGHHLQIAIAMETKGLPLFRMMGPFSAFSEGWALYAERLAWEMGYVTDPYDNVGRLLSELFRSVRLVVDTGLHAKHWTREQAITYMMDNGATAESEAVREIERYIVLPGQATSYKIGMMEILALREQAKAALGDAFDIREFHAVVLEEGAMPLVILRERVEAWIAAKQVG